MTKVHRNGQRPMAIPKIRPQRLVKRSVIASYNPGKALTANIDINGDGQLKEIVIPADALHMPAAKRTYKAVELTFERAWDKRWSLQGSYVLSYSKGNAEGYVKSDIGQTTLVSVRTLTTLA